MKKHFRHSVQSFKEGTAIRCEAAPSFQEGAGGGLRLLLLALLILCSITQLALAQAKKKSTKKVEVPDWALPGSKTRKQVPPPTDFHRKTKTNNKKIGIFDGQSEVGAALVSGSSSYDKATGKYTITSAGYNIWYTRDEFRYLWKKMSGDVSLAADISFPDSGFYDRKTVLIIRQSLDDDSKEAMVALHGGGLIHLAWRETAGASIKQMRFDKKGAVRLGIEKQGDAFSLYVSQTGEPIFKFGEPTQLHFDEPFYVGIGFCSHIPDLLDTSVLSNVVLENAAGKVK